MFLSKRNLIEYNNRVIKLIIEFFYPEKRMCKLINIIFTIFVICVFSDSVLGQTITWQKILNNNYGSLERAFQTDDNNFIAVGSDSRVGGYQIYLARYSFSGDSLWTQIIGKNNYSFRGNWVINGITNGFTICGSTNKGGLGDGYLLNTDSKGNVIWNRSFNGLGLDQSLCVKQTSDNGYIVLNRTDGFFNNIMLIKTNEIGEIQWQKIYYANNDQYGKEVIVLEDSYVIIGTAHADVYLFKVNLNGDTLWSKRFGSNYSEAGYSIQRTIDKGFIIGGVEYNSNNVSNSLIIKADSVGNLQWKRNYSAKYNELLYSVRNIPGKGYVFCGTTDSTNNNLERGFIRIIDFNGNVLIQNFYRPLQYFTEIRSVESTNDNGFIICGVTQMLQGGVPQMYLAKTDSLGKIFPVGISYNSTFIPKKTILHQNNPNPFNPITTIDFEIKNKTNVSLVIYDLSGKEVSTIYNGLANEGKYRINFNSTDYNLSTGIYFFQLKTEIDLISKKMMLIK